MYMYIFIFFCYKSFMYPVLVGMRRCSCESKVVEVKIVFFIPVVSNLFKIF